MQETNWFENKSVEEKHERDYLRRILMGSLLAVFFCWAVIYAVASHAAPELVAVDRNDRPMKLTLLTGPCPESVRKWFDRIHPALHSGMRAAKLLYGGKVWDSCWIELQGHVFSIDEEGVPLQGGQGIPRAMFRESTI